VLSTYGFSVGIEILPISEDRIAELKFVDEFKESFGVEIFCKSRPANKAIGLASNKETRERAAKAALALSTLLAEGPDSEPIQRLEPKVSERVQALLQEARAIKPSMPPPSEAPKLNPTIGSMSAPMRPAPAMAMVTVNPTWSYPEACAKDPFAELRDFQGQGPWPFCTNCNCWSDEGHITGKKHLKALQWLQQTQAAVAQVPTLVVQPQPRPPAPRPPPPPPPAPPAGAANNSWNWEDDLLASAPAAVAAQGSSSTDAEGADYIQTPDFPPPEVTFESIFETFSKNVAFDWDKVEKPVRDPNKAPMQ